MILLFLMYSCFVCLWQNSRCNSTFQNINCSFERYSFFTAINFNFFSTQINHRFATRISECIRDVAQPGSVPAWGAGGRWFESSRPDLKKALEKSRAFFTFELV